MSNACHPERSRGIPQIVLSVASALLVCSCASAPRIAPRFEKVSTAPVAAAVSAATKANTQTKSHIAAAKEIVRTIHLSLPEDQTKIDALTRELASASDAVDLAESALAQSVGALDAVNVQLQQQTDKANQLADSYDKAAVQITSLKESRHRWVKLFLTSSFLLLTSVAFIFRKPLMMAAGFPPL